MEAKGRSFRRIQKVTEKCLLPTILLIVWGAMLLPTIFYIVSRTNKEAESLQIATDCSGEAYSGDACLQSLKELQTCFLGRNNSQVYISSAVNQKENEDFAQLMVDGIRAGLIETTPECVDAFLPFMCLYLFPLCNGTSGEAYLPSQEDCLAISNDICPMEWKLASSLAGDKFPICETLPQDQNEEFGITTCNSNKGEFILPAPDQASNSNNNNNTVCSKDFFLVNGSCRPLCGAWRESSYHTTKAVEISVIAAIIIGMIAACILLVISCLRRNIMFQFPPILMIYFILSLFVAGIFTLMGFSNREGHYCSSQNLLDAYITSTTFCTSIGAILTYILLQAPLFGIMHMLALSWTIFFPFVKKRFDNAGKTKYLHISSVLIGLLVPSIPVILAFATDGFVITKSLPFVCLVKNLDVFYYTFLLPISIACATELTLLLLLVRKLINHNGSIGIAERKLMAVFLYVLIVFALWVAIFTSRISSSNEYASQLGIYFTCESTGVAANKTCDRSGFEDMQNNELEMVLHLLIGLVPVSFLVYAIDFSVAKQLVLRCCRKTKPGNSNSIQLSKISPSQENLS